VESVRSQTYVNWDYTIVNNCSSDRSLAIAREYAAVDARIRVVSNAQFLSAVGNYNEAFRHASPNSRYVKPVAADDQLVPECVERMVEIAEHHPEVAIVGAYGRVGDNILRTGVPYPTTVMAGRDVARRWMLEGKYVFGTPTSTLYRTEDVRVTRDFMNEALYLADADVCLRLLADEHRSFGFVHQVLTVEDVREKSRSGDAERIQSHLPEIIGVLQRYGTVFLTADELREHLEMSWHRYYRYLGEQYFRGRDTEFWSFHREKMQSLGCPLDRGRLAVRAAAHLADVVLNPKQMVDDWRRRRRARKTLQAVPAPRSATGNSVASVVRNGGG
jgi:glycosyltransferase involved in cell wall biosynthesis